MILFWSKWEKFNLCSLWTTKPRRAEWFGFIVHHSAESQRVKRTWDQTEKNLGVSTLSINNESPLFFSFLFFVVVVTVVTRFHPFSPHAADSMTRAQLLSQHHWSLCDSGTALPPPAQLFSDVQLPLTQVYWPCCRCVIRKAEPPVTHTKCVHVLLWSLCGCRCRQSWIAERGTSLC